MIYRNRDEAGRILAQELARRGLGKDAVILAVPRGGLPVGAAIAETLGLPLDVVLVKKIGLPEDPECAVGAVSLTSLELDETAARFFGLPPGYVEEEAARLRAVLRERERFYRAGRPAEPVAGRTAVLVDDGAATGMTMLSAAALLRADGAARLIAAVPVASVQAAEALGERADALVCPLTEKAFGAVGRYYRDFAQVSDDEAASVLRASQRALQGKS